MGNWGYQKSGRQRQVFRAKLYLLAVGILILGALLFREGDKAGEKGNPPQPEAVPETREEEENGEEKTETEPETVPGTQPLEYSGRIRVLLKTTGYEGELHEELRLSSASGQDLTVYDRENGETIDSGNSLSFTREEDTLFLNGEPLAELYSCMRVRPAEGDGAGIAVETVERNSGIPVYEGELEIWPAEEGFYLVNDLPFETYLKYVVPSEMPSGYSMEALKAQAVCARTYALWQSKHYASYKFDVCNTTDCQVYYGLNQASPLTDRAAEETAGVVITYDGAYAETYYCSSNGGASESSGNVWITDLPYLVGKEDPYEGTISIPGYRWSVSYTWDQLTRVLQSKGYSIGSVRDAYVSRTTPTGNVAEITFVDDSGDALRVTGETCRTVFYTTLFGETKSVRSMRFSITGGSGGSGVAVNEGGTLPGLDGVYAVTGGGLAQLPGDDVYVVTSGGVSRLEPEQGSASADGITITGTGLGHNVGMSQYGARAMAELGYTYEDILYFYFTGIELERIR